MLNKFNVVAIVVTYHPNLHALAALLNTIQPQVDGTVVVDNGSSIALDDWLVGDYSDVTHIALGKNYGIAKAQNTGIDWARNKHADYIILFDQDSMPATDMAGHLLAVAKSKEADGIRVAGVGPRYLDVRQNNPPPFIRVNGLKIERQRCSSVDSVVEVDYLISSGCLIPMATLNAVGDLQGELFIDYVDIEWGLRAKHLGYQSFGACGANMNHDLGDDPIEFLGCSIPVRIPLRHYYHFRNAVWMYRQDWVPLNFKLADGWRLFLKYGFYSLFAKPQLSHCWMMTQGIWHGLTGRMGGLHD